MNYLFVYGTLKRQELADKVLKKKLPLNPIFLKGYSKRHVTGKAADEFTIERNPLGRVNGDLIEVNSRELELCDRWESTYVRKKISTYGEGDVYAYFYKGDT